MVAQGISALQNPGELIIVCYILLFLLGIVHLPS